MTTIINLASLRPPLAKVDLGGGGEHQVHHITGHAMELMLASRDENHLTKLWEAAALCVPTASQEAVFALSVPQVEAILGIAAGKSTDELGSAE